ncbi:MAG TPA: choice-of-anchor Q domain-containing protein [Acidimicrobiales bacterium]
MGSAVAALLCGVFGLGVFALSGVPSGAATSATLFVDNVNGTVTTGCGSSGAGACKTIQQGVTAAEALSATNVTLNVAGSATAYNESVVINLPSGPGDSLDIEGTGATLPTLDNGGTGSGFTIASTSAGDVTIDHMTISHGSSAFGGGINDIGTGKLSVGNDTFSNNKATGGSPSQGGAIDVADSCEGGTGGVAVVTNSTFVGNSADGDGGAIDSQDFCSGGPTTGSLTVTGSTFQSNTAGFGGGVNTWNTGNTITNSTFTANSTTSANEGGGASVANTALMDDTFFGNSDGAVFPNGGTVSLANSILDNASTGVDCTAHLTDGGHNVTSDATCGLGGTSIENSTTIGTLTLAANGSTGPQTAAITSTSSAHGIVPAASCTVTTDQRGQPRPGIGFTACDAGAYEIQKTTGYDLAGTDGGVFVFPVGMTQGFFGSIPGLGIHINNIKGLVPTNNYNGYNLVGSDGGVFVFPLGMPAGFYGSLPGLHVSVNNVVGLVGTNNNHGYNLVGSDGGVFVFPTGQSAGFYGSLPGLGVHTNNIIGIVEQPDGGGYLLVGRDGGVFAFGDAKYLGSLPGSGITVNNIVGIATTLDGKGYYLVGSDGSVYPFGDAVNHGSLPALHVTVNNVTAIVPTADGGGYWLICTDGGVFAFGDAGFIGSLPGLKVTPVSPIIGAVQTLNAP